MLKYETMATVTPMLKQYQTIKSQHKDAILLFRLGDFYEMFYEDAQVASKALDLVLTSRGKDPAGKIPMCGVPYHAANNYIDKLIKNGFKVAICDQIENPSDTKGIVKRDVTRIITSGTYLDENNNDTRYLLSVSPSGNTFGIAFSDAVTGTIQTNQYTDANRVIELIARLPICECLYPESQKEHVKTLFNHPLLKNKAITLSPFDDWCFNTDMAHKTLCEHFSVSQLNGFGIEKLEQSQSSAGALLEYLRTMNKQPLKHIKRLSLYSDTDYVSISPAACYGLELESLRKNLDHTQTALGKRMFRFWLYHPLKDGTAIEQRQQAIQFLLNNNDTRQNLASLLSSIPDLEKNISRLSCGYRSPKDMLAIRNTLMLLPEIKKCLDSTEHNSPLFDLSDIPALKQYLETVIDPDMPSTHYEGKVIRRGFHEELDQLRDIQENGRKHLQNLQAEEIKRTGINSLKIGFNKVFGYYIEVTKSNISAVPEDFIRKQTLVNAERYITPALKEFEEKILTAQGKIQAIEDQLLDEVLNEILKYASELQQCCDQIATIDVLYSLSVLAGQPNYIFPDMAADTIINIKEGRHPVVESTLTENFIPNDTLLDCEQNHLLILTGPNMSGKSTYIRQTAILVIMAQIGSAIPAQSATIGLVDKIFTRIGAHDDISKGLSTFMVEMTEAAEILNNLTNRSLVILDEIGRGTSTFDGLSLAWSLAEYLKDKKVRTLFATHFHELTALADDHEGVKNYNVAVKEWKDEIIFMHKIVPGSTDDSYGIYVAKLAGIPQDVITRAKQILAQLEQQGNLKEKLRGQAQEEQLAFFNAQPDSVAEELRAKLDNLNINELTPLEALNALEELKRSIEDE